MPALTRPGRRRDEERSLGRLTARMQDANDRRAQVGARGEGVHVVRIERRGERIEVDATEEHEPGGAPDRLARELRPRPAALLRAIHRPRS